MLEVICASGAVIHVDESHPGQMLMLPTAVAAFGGEVFRADLTVADEATA